MQCSICGHRTKTLAAMSAHYRKKHPSKMKRKTVAARSGHKDVRADERLIYSVLKREHLI